MKSNVYEINLRKLSRQTKHAKREIRATKVCISEHMRTRVFISRFEYNSES